MRIIQSQKMVGGWFVGDFEPTAFKTPVCEVCYKVHSQGERWPRHYHKVATEINYLISGEMVIQGHRLVTGDIFIIEPEEVADPEFLTECRLIVVKIPSVPGDKYTVE